MYNKKFDDIIGQIIQSTPPPERRIALVDFQRELEIEAPKKCCLRCNHADFFISFSTNKCVHSFKRCGKFMDLYRNDAGDLVLPDVPFCTSSEEGQS